MDHTSRPFTTVIGLFILALALSNASSIAAGEGGGRGNGGGGRGGHPEGGARRGGPPGRGEARGNGGGKEEEEQSGDDIVEDMENDLLQMMSGMGHGGPAYQSSGGNSGSTPNPATVIVPVTINAGPIAISAPIIENSPAAIIEVEKARAQLEELPLTDSEKNNLEAVISQFRDNKADAADVSKVMSSIVGRLEKTGPTEREQTLSGISTTAAVTTSVPNSGAYPASNPAYATANNVIMTGGTNVQVTNEQTANPTIPITINNIEKKSDAPFGDLKAELDLAPKSGINAQVVNAKEFMKEYAPPLKQLMKVQGRDFDSNLSQRIAELSGHKPMVARAPASARKGGKDDLSHFLDSSPHVMAAMPTAGKGKAALPLILFFGLTGILGFAGRIFKNQILSLWRRRGIPSGLTPLGHPDVRPISPTARLEEGEFTDITKMVVRPKKP